MRFIIVLITSLFVLSLSSFAQNKKPRTGKESLFGKKLATYQITSNELSGAWFYLVFPLTVRQNVTVTDGRL